MALNGPDPGQHAAEIVAALSGLGLRLHGFGVKTLGPAAYADHLPSADSLAWNFDTRYARPLPGCPTSTVATACGTPSAGVPGCSTASACPPPDAQPPRRRTAVISSPASCSAASRSAGGVARLEPEGNGALVGGGDGHVVRVAWDATDGGHTRDATGAVPGMEASASWCWPAWGRNWGTGMSSPARWANPWGRSWS